MKSANLRAESRKRNSACCDSDDHCNYKAKEIPGVLYQDTAD